LGGLKACLNYDSSDSSDDLDDGFKWMVLLGVLVGLNVYDDPYGTITVIIQIR
jgi:hypothetical protein